MARRSSRKRGNRDQPDRRGQDAKPAPERQSDPGLPEVLGEDEVARPPNNVRIACSCASPRYQPVLRSMIAIATDVSTAAR